MAIRTEGSGNRSQDFDREPLFASNAIGGLVEQMGAVNVRHLRDIACTEEQWGVDAVGTTGPWDTWWFFVCPDGWAVVNAEDDRVFARRGRSPGRVFAFSTDPGTAEREVLDSGGSVATVEDGWVIVNGAGGVARIVEIAEGPISLAGLSPNRAARTLWR